MPRPGRPGFSSDSSYSSCIPMQIARNGTPRVTASRATVASPEATGDALEARLDHVMGVVAGALADVQRGIRRGGERVPEVAGHLRVERRVAQWQHLTEGHVPHDERASGQIEGNLDEGLVER